MIRDEVCRERGVGDVCTCILGRELFVARLDRCRYMDQDFQD